MTEIKKTDIAVIGMSCRFPGAGNYVEFWENLKAGRSGISEVPASRWDWKAYWGDPQTEMNKSNSKWGGFLAGVDHFDPDFFGISVREVERMDPQQRIMLELTWACLEDAGIPPSSLSGKKAGVFLGVFNFDYKELQERSGQLAIEAHHSTGTASALIANRISYYFNLRGPSIPIDTACSSSLSAIHAAIQSLVNGECTIAIAGGINLLLTPTRHISFSKTGMLSPTGSCKTFDDQADGYVRGEGAGLLLLKPLAQALADGDPIYGVIKGSAVNHGGRTYSLTYPNPDAQRDVILDAQRMAGVVPESISYVEVHGTGTPKGDPIEFQGLTAAFSSNGREAGDNENEGKGDEAKGNETSGRGATTRPYCGLASVKTNIGHLEAAAGVAGIIKVLLSMQSRQLPGLLHFKSLNHRISLDNSPFYLVTELKEWEPLRNENNDALPRRAGVSSFGFGGTNAHVVLEEGPAPRTKESGDRRIPPYYLVCLSAKTEENLLRRRKDLTTWLQDGRPLPVLADLCKTLSAGREHFSKRAIWIVHSIEQLVQKLARPEQQAAVDGYYTSSDSLQQQEPGQPFYAGMAAVISATLDKDEEIRNEVYYDQLSILAGLYVNGYDLDWERPWFGAHGRRIGLPAYPFSQGSYWIPELKEGGRAGQSRTGQATTGETTAGETITDLRGQRFSQTFTGDEFFLRDHVVTGRKVLPAVVYLEMARGAVLKSATAQKGDSSRLCLKNIIWVRPVIAGGEPMEVNTVLYPGQDNTIVFEVSGLSSGESREVPIYSQGIARFEDGPAYAGINIEEVRAACHQHKFEQADCYRILKEMGFEYGPAHQGLTAVYTGADRHLALLNLPAAVAGGMENYFLHPSLMDAALQAALLAGVTDGDEDPALYLPFALDTIEMIQPCTTSMWAVIGTAANTAGRRRSPLKRIDIDLCDREGNICVRMKGMSFKLLEAGGFEHHTDRPGTMAAETALLLTPVWKEQTVINMPVSDQFIQRLVFLCEPGVIAEDLKMQLPGARVMILQGAQANAGERYQGYVRKVFEEIQTLLKERPKGRVLVQVLISEKEGSVLFSGLSGLLRTASLEDPRLIGQLIRAAAGQDIVAALQTNAGQDTDATIRHMDGKRYVAGWMELSPAADSGHSPWRENGVYLITGGAGGLGLIFAREIAAQAEHPTLILTGRTARNEAIDAHIDGLRSIGAQAEYRQLDVSDKRALAAGIQAIQKEYKGLNGVFHCAGVVQDNYVIRKTKEELLSVLTPKVLGVTYIDEATKEIPLDLFVLFSSITGPLGNAGQADYAAANAYMDEYAVWRNHLAGIGQRHGRTLVIDWPLWKEGGMQLGKDMEAAFLDRMKMSLLETDTGIRSFYRALDAGVTQVLVAPGNKIALREKYIGRQDAQPVGEDSQPMREDAQPVRADSQPVKEGPSQKRVVHYLKEVLSIIIKRPVELIDAGAAMEEYGIDSIMVMQMTTQLEKVFGALPKTLFFEYQNIEELSQYFMENHPGKFGEAVGIEKAAATEIPGEVKPIAGDARVDQPDRQPLHRSEERPGALGIAIIGMSGRYPQADNLQEFWNNLQQGKDCITEIPKDRWDYHPYFDADKDKEGKSYSKWGGFLKDVDKFDPLFFNISPLEAERMDPQERLFLQCVYETIEDAGYTRQSLGRQKSAGLGNNVGVYAGVMYEEYQLFGAQEALYGRPVATWGLPSSIANRVSYFCDFHGPSMAVDTMCSSSLTAIHLACESIARGKCEAAIAGGVNVSIHPNKYLFLSQGRFASSKGRCESFGAGGDGYVPGEGVGAVLLKPLERAIADGDHIYGVIRSTAINHGGKTNGYTVPNLKAQASVIGDAFREAGIDPRTLSYLEAHGTGTSLGDPIEVAGLSKVIHEYTRDTQFCAIGSAKSNIGHCESAAGIAGVTKVLLQMKYRQLVPSLHSGTLNANIDFSDSPFRVQQGLSEWRRPVLQKDGTAKEYPLCAGISSFGAGGANAHIVIEEYIPDSHREPAANGVHGDTPVIILLSAMDGGRLEEQAKNLLSAIRGENKTFWRLSERVLADLAYTLQVGREPMEHRLAVLVNSLDMLEEKMEAFIGEEREIAGLFRGHVQKTLSAVEDDDNLREVVKGWMRNNKYEKIAAHWVKGGKVSWKALFENGGRPQRISMPTYPFKRDRYWIGEISDNPMAFQPGQRKVCHIHPLLHENVSDLTGHRFRVNFSGDEFYLKDHRVHGKKILPAAASIEMIREAIWQSVLSFDVKIRDLQLKNISWLQPVIVEDDTVSVMTELYLEDNGEIGFEIYAADPDSPAEREVFCRGTAAYHTAVPVNSIGTMGVETLRQRCRKPVISRQTAYAAFEKAGFQYGSTHQGLEQVYIGDNVLLAKIALPSLAFDSQGIFLLHPGLLDAALQATLLWNWEAGQPLEMAVPVAVELVEMYKEITPAAWVVISRAGDRVFDIDLLTPEGDLCVRLKGMSFSLSSPKGPGGGSETLLLYPSWERKPTAQAANNGPGRQVIIIAGLDSIVAGCRSRLPDADIVALPSPLAADFEDISSTVFGKVQDLLKGKGKASMQVLVPMDGEARLYAGLAGLLRTAEKENPAFQGQVIVLPEEDNSIDLVQQNSVASFDAAIRYRNGHREVLQWEIWEGKISDGKIVDGDRKDIPWKNRGVYLITGGAGGLGFIFAKEIAQAAKDVTLVLTGRTVMDPAKKIKIAELQALGASVYYRQADVSDAGSVQQLIRFIQEGNGGLNGIIHSAGITADNYLINKTREEWHSVLAPKVKGVQNLDQASKDLSLDLFIFFSSVSGALGNAGQGDYAAANAFMDEYAAYRNGLVARGLRQGHTVSVNWPLWQDGGMRVDAETERYLYESMAIVPLRTETGIRSLYRVLNSGHSQVMVMQGDRERIREKIRAQRDAPATVSVPAPESLSTIDVKIVEEAIAYFTKVLSSVIRLPSEKIMPDVAMEEYGIDSVMVMKMTARLEKLFGNLSKTLFFEYQNIRQLANYFLEEHYARMADVLGIDNKKETNKKEAAAVLQPANFLELLQSGSHRRRSLQPSGLRGTGSGDKSGVLDIAIVGMGGKYPQADNLNEFWENLVRGKDCITEIPMDRWDYRRYFDTDKNKPGTTYSKWGGFLNGVDQFDPLFFNISPREAELLDPQERLFLQCVYETMEDAGYSRQTLADGTADGLAGNVGVFAGVMYEEYQLFGVEESMRGQNIALFGNPSSIANRVSYFYNFNGPSMAVDTMCSSSLTAIHLACQAIRQGDCKAAIAGGVNISIHPNKYLLLAQGKFISGKGRCESFGEGGDGYVPGEGVGAVFLRPLAEAIADGDHIYGVIKASSINHGGKTNGYTVPNPNAQAKVIQKAYERSGIDARTISYVEAHGTGTSLGDPIEITGLKKAYREYTGDNGFCAIGSVKSNIGHGESAAGIAGLTKILLQFQHRQLVPSLHSEVLNPHIDFADTPFVVNQTLSEWKRPIIGHNGQAREYLRRAGISSFGAGGSNAHLIIEEFEGPVAPQRDGPNEPVIILFSAKNTDRLRELVRKMAGLLRSGRFGDPDLADIAFTLQTGRDALECRMAMVVTSIAVLSERLDAFLREEEELDGVYLGNADHDNITIAAFAADEELREAVEKWVDRKKYAKLCAFWVKGLPVDWSRIYKGATVQGPPPRRVSLPTYPFARDRYWVPVSDTTPAAPQPMHAGPQPVPPAAAARPPDTVLVQPVWIDRALPSSGTTPSYDRHIIVVAGSQPDHISEKIKNARIVALPVQRYRPEELLQECSWQVLLEIREALQQDAAGKVLMQVLVQGEYAMLSALHATLKAATLENPRFTGQLIETSGDLTTGALLTILQENSRAAGNAHIRYQDHQRQEIALQEFSGVAENVALPWKDGGVYLIPGGAGGIGLIFIREMIRSMKTGRIIATGRSELSGSRQQQFTSLQTGGVSVEYRQVDITDRRSVDQVIAEILLAYGKLDGVIHSAGVAKEAFFIHKTRKDWQDVMAPKVEGLINLDEATKEIALDLFIIFSSTAGIIGNPGQTDYATANAFMDIYAGRRNKMVAEGLRKGPAVSINWPLWREGGMQVPREMEAALEKRTGMLPLETAAALQAFYRVVASGMAQLAVLYGDRRRIGEKLLQQRVVQRESIRKVPPPAANKELLQANTLQQLKMLFGQVVKLSPEKIDPRGDFQNYGLNSVMIVQLNQLLEKIFGDLSKTMFYEYQDLGSLSAYLVRYHADACLEWTGTAASSGPGRGPETEGPASEGPASEGLETEGEDKEGLEREGVEKEGQKREDQKKERPVAAAPVESREREPIAIIGLSGRYPMADTLQQYWENLKAGKDCISEIPADRWGLDGFYHPDRERAIEEGKSYSKWGGFLDGFADFDPLFFNISPREAITMDPQERIFLQACWEVLEDAGYTRERIAEQFDRNVGVFAGVTKTGYELYGPELWRQGFQHMLRTSFGSVANRVSFHFNFKGPSMPIDTMCSSSLTAIHEACENLLKDSCAMAIAGGVNLYLHPLNYISLCSLNFLSEDGKCRSFGSGGTGYVPGEGVGAVLLKRLSRAIADGDHIYGVIRGTSINHGGKTSGFTVPNPVSQGDLIRQALDKAGVNARDISYVEAHGTGTSLGDPIEISGLSRAFRDDTADRQFCAIGSAKSNIGHLESAAGMAGLTKILLQMKHGILVPTLHADELNTNINFEQSPFYVQRGASTWNGPKIASISSFGAGGSNAHMIVEEYIPGRDDTADEAATPVTIVLSARDKSRLQDRARQLLAYVNNNEPAGLADIGYTLQVGREQMEERLAILVHSLDDLKEKLGAFLAGEPVGRTQTEETGWQTGETGRVRGKRISLPAYPFAKVKYWLPVGALSTPPPEKEWLFTKEEWAPAPPDAKIDWDERFRQYKGKTICIIYQDEEDGRGLTKLLERMAGSIGVERSPVIRGVHAAQVDVEKIKEISPAVVLFTGPGKLADPSIQPVEGDIALVYGVIQCLMQAAWDKVIDLYYLYETNDINPRLDCQSLSGLFQSAIKENGQHIWTSIRVHQETDAGAKHQLLIKEWLAAVRPGLRPGRFTAVEYREGRRLVRRLEETDLAPAVRPVFRVKGNYIVAGGMGYIGGRLLEELARRYQANISIISRAPMDAERQEQCRRLEALGARVHYYAGDITDMTALRAIYMQIRQTVGNIHGVINLARAHDSKGLVSKSWKSFDRISQVKIAGTLNLDLLTKDENLDLFILFASIGGYGARGDADYAYSVAYQCAFARYRRQLMQRGQRSGITVAQCWGPWEEDRLFPESRKKLKEAGVGLIDMRSAFPLIEASFGYEDAVIGICAVIDKDKTKAIIGMGIPDTMETLIGQWETRKMQGQPTDIAEVQKIIPADKMQELDTAMIERIYRLCFDEERPAREGILSAIRQSALEVLQIDSIDDARAFQHYGLDSIMAMRLSTNIAKRLEMEIQPRWLIEFPTLNELAAHLVR